MSLLLEVLIVALLANVEARPWKGALALVGAVTETEKGRNFETQWPDVFHQASQSNSQHFHRGDNSAGRVGLLSSWHVRFSSFFSGPSNPGFALPFKNRNPDDEPEKDIEQAVEEVEEEAEEVEEEAEEKEQEEKRKGIHIFESRSFFDWTVFAVFATFFMWIYQRFFIGLPSATKYHGLAIVGWLLLGVLYNFFMYLKFGAEDATLWLNGYLLEIIFSLENVFVFHVIIESFGTTTVAAQRCLFIIVCFQVLFELLLYMGVADIIDSLGFLPYVLGAWLCYLGMHVSCETQDHSDFDISETCTVRTFRALLGRRLDEDVSTPRPSDESATAIFSYNSDDGLRLTLLGLVFLCLLGADFVLEIDVTLTKIEQSHDEYLSFTSSALAGFAVPELFFVARDLFRKFQLLKFGIAFVLLFYGIDMLFPNLFNLTPIEGCGLIIVVMLLCMVLSICTTKLCGPPEDDHATVALEKEVEAVKDYGTQTSTLKQPIPRRNQRFSFVFDRSSHISHAAPYDRSDQASPFGRSSQASPFDRSSQASPFDRSRQVSPATSDGQQTRTSA